MTDRESAPALPLDWDLTSAEVARRPRNPVAQPHAINVHQLVQIQAEVRETERERGTIHESLVQKCLILSEETFEVLKILRPRSGIATSNFPDWSLADELADVLFVASAIANRIPEDLAVLGEAIPSVDSSPHLRRTELREAILAAALDMSQVVLSLMVSCRAFAESPLPDRRDMVTRDLVGLLVAVNSVADLARIDLMKALDGKLMKDQLRLWS